MEKKDVMVILTIVIVCWVNLVLSKLLFPQFSQALWFNLVVLAINIIMCLLMVQALFAVYEFGVARRQQKAIDQEIKEDKQRQQQNIPQASSPNEIGYERKRKSLSDQYWENLGL